MADPTLFDPGPYDTSPSPGLWGRIRSLMSAGAPSAATTDGGAERLRDALAASRAAPAGERIATLAGTPYVNRLTRWGLPAAIQYAGNTALAHSGLSPTGQAVGSQGVNALANMLYLTKARKVPLSLGSAAGHTGAALGLGLGGMALENLVDPEDTKGADIHDVGQGAQTASVVGPLAIAMGASGPVGWGIGGIAGLGAATNWFGLGDQKGPRKLTNDDLANSLMWYGNRVGMPVSEEKANAAASGLREAIVSQVFDQTGKRIKSEDVTQEMVDSAVAPLLQQFAQQSGYESPLAQQLGDVFGIDAAASPADQILSDVYDTVSEYQRAYAAEQAPILSAMDTLSSQLGGMNNYEGMAPEYAAMARANEAVMRAQIASKQQAMRAAAYQGPMDIARDFAYALSQGYEPGRTSSGGGASIADILAGAGG